jgi:DNA modification methylase
LITFLQGNCLDKIQELDDNSIDCVVSSPPYFGLRDYGVDGQFGLEKTYHDYLANTVKVFETFKPKLKDTATIWWNVGDSYSNHKDCKSIGQTLAKGTIREKAHEIEKGKSHTRDSKLLKASGLKDKDLMMIPNRVAIALQDAGWYIRSEIIWHKPNPMPESVRDRPTSCHEKIWLITKNKKYYYDAESIREPAKDCNFAEKGRNKRNVWTITTKPFKDAHFATFPKDLIEPCIKAGCPEGGVVLDPFGGSGTTGIVAALNNRNAILIELNQNYIDIANKRIDKEVGLFNG